VHPRRMPGALVEKKKKKYAVDIIAKSDIKSTL
jgi:hypothetical protein